MTRAPRSRRLAVPLAALVLVAGCGGSAPDPDGSSDPDGTEPDVVGTNGPPREYEFTLYNRQVNPVLNRPVSADVGETFELTVTSNLADEIHVHGVEEFLVLEADEPGTLVFEIPVGLPPDRYPVEAHGGLVKLMELRVR